MLHLQVALLALQQMWEDIGVTWEWTWYSQTAHAFTQPQLVGGAASEVSLFCCAVMSFAVRGTETFDKNDFKWLFCVVQSCAGLHCTTKAQDS